MQKRICIINFSASEIQIKVLADRGLEAINFSLPWEVGFRQETDGTLVACFGEAFDRLDSNNPNEIQFPNLDVVLQNLTDSETLECLFQAFFEEIFQQRLPEHGYSIEAMSVYLITPYQWKSAHRQQLRKVLKIIESNSRIGVSTPPSIVLRGILSEVLCLAIYYQETWTDILVNVSKLHFFFLDFKRHDLMLYQLVCKQSSDYATVELYDALRLPDFFTDIEKQVSNVQRVLKTVGETVPLAVGFSGRINHSGRAIIELLQAHGSAIFLEPQEAATLLGGVKLVQQFTEKSVAKHLHFVYNFCFGVQLPDGKWIELVPKTWTPPYNSKRAFRVTGTLNKIYIPLFCGISLSDNSDVHHLATIEIDYSEDFPSRNSDEFILSITLNDATHGTFTVHFPSSREPISVEFKAPVLME